MRTTSVCFALACVVLATPALSSAQDPGRDTGGGPARVFGSVGQLAISSDAALLIQHSSNDATQIQFGPAADYFLARNISLGGVILLDYTQADRSDALRFSIGPRVGYHLAFTDMLGIWPKIGFSFTHTNISTDIPTGDEDTEASVSRSNNAFTLNLFVPFTFHPVPHFFVGFGPFLDADLSGDNRVTYFGARLTLGGWFDT